MTILQADTRPDSLSSSHNSEEKILDGLCRTTVTALRSHGCLALLHSPISSRNAALIGQSGLPRPYLVQLERRLRQVSGIDVPANLPPGQEPVHHFSPACISADFFKTETTDPLCFPHVLEAATDVDGVGRLDIFVMRGAGAEPFNETDRSAAHGFCTMMAAYLALSREHTRVIGCWDGARQALNCLNIGVVLADRHNVPVSVNQAAAEILSPPGNGADDLQSGKGIRRVLERVSAKSGAAVLSEIAGPVPADETGDLAPGFERGRTVAVAIPLCIDPARHESGQPTTAFFLYDAKRPRTPDQDAIRELYRLTRLEAQLVCLMMEDQDLHQIAANLRISVHTARAYLKRIFGKIGVHRQTNLMKLVLLHGFGSLRPGLPERRPAHGSIVQVPSWDSEQHDATSTISPP